MGRDDEHFDGDGGESSPKTTFATILGRFLITAILLATIAYLGALLISRTEGFKAVVADTIADKLGAEVEIERARLEPGLGLTIGDVAISQSGTEEKIIFKADRVRIEFGVAANGSFWPEPDRIVIAKGAFKAAEGVNSTWPLELAGLNLVWDSISYQSNNLLEGEATDNEVLPKWLDELVAGGCEWSLLDWQLADYPGGSNSQVENPGRAASVSIIPLKPDGGPFLYISVEYRVSHESKKDSSGLRREWIYKDGDMIPL